MVQPEISAGEYLTFSMQSDRHVFPPFKSEVSKTDKVLCNGSYTVSRNPAWGFRCLVFFMASPVIQTARPQLLSNPLTPFL